MSRCTRSSCTSSSQSKHATRSIRLAAEIFSKTVMARSGFSEEIEVLILLPNRRLVIPQHAGLVLPIPVAAGFVALEPQVIVDENVPQPFAEKRLLFQRVERLRQAFRQHGAGRRVGLVVGRARLETAVDAGQSGDDLRQDVQVRAGPRL